MNNAATLSPLDRQADDFYATPASCVEQLLQVERFGSKIWEPACGDGAISRVLQKHGFDVRSTDLVERGYGDTDIDFLWERANPSNRSIITNPPFKLGTEFARHALTLSDHVALLLKVGFLEGPTKADLHDSLSRIWVIRRRVTFLKNGKEFSRSNGKGGIHTYAWFVWDRRHTGPVQLGWLEGEPCK